MRGNSVIESIGRAVLSLLLFLPDRVSAYPLFPIKPSLTLDFYLKKPFHSTEINCLMAISHVHRIFSTLNQSTKTSWFFLVAVHTDIHFCRAQYFKKLPTHSRPHVVSVLERSGYDTNQSLPASDWFVNLYEMGRSKTPKPSTLIETGIVIVGDSEWRLSLSREAKLCDP